MWERSRAGVLMSGATVMPQQIPPHAPPGSHYRVLSPSLAGNHLPRFALR
jgi:hypothetical protein